MGGANFSRKFIKIEVLIPVGMVTVRIGQLARASVVQRV
jgi:hypothetical protein